MTNDTDPIAALKTRLLRDSYHACINDGCYVEIVDLFTDDAFVRLGYLVEYPGRNAINGGFCGIG